MRDKTADMYDGALWFMWWRALAWAGFYVYCVSLPEKVDPEAKYGPT